MLTYLTSNLDNFLVGRFLGPASLGAYRLSYNLVIYPLSNLSGPIVSVLFPAFSRMAGERDRLISGYLRASRLIVAITLPLFLLIVITIPDFVPVVLGSRWSNTTTVIQVLAWLGILQSLRALNTAILQASRPPRPAVSHRPRRSARLRAGLCRRSSLGHRRRGPGRNDRGQHHSTPLHDRCGPYPRDPEPRGDRPVPTGDSGSGCVIRARPRCSASSSSISTCPPLRGCRARLHVRPPSTSHSPSRRSPAFVTKHAGFGGERRTAGSRGKPSRLPARCKSFPYTRFVCWAPKRENAWHSGDSDDGAGVVGETCFSDCPPSSSASSPCPWRWRASIPRTPRHGLRGCKSSGRRAWRPGTSRNGGAGPTPARIMIRARAIARLKESRLGMRTKGSIR